MEQEPQRPPTVAEIVAQARQARKPEQSRRLTVAELVEQARAQRLAEIQAGKKGAAEPPIRDGIPGRERDLSYELRRPSSTLEQQRRRRERELER